MLRFIYEALYDGLATFDVAGGVLLAAIWFQAGYVALFRAIHGEDAGAPPPAARTARRPAGAGLPPLP
jgi:hypothetical protein